VPLERSSARRCGRQAYNRPVRTGLTIDDLGDLLEQPIVAVLATYRRSGDVMLSPVWFEWRDGGINIWTGGPVDGKVRHLERDARASVVIAEQVMPLRGLELSGRATLSIDGFYDVVRRTAIRYEGPDGADQLAASFSEPRPVIRLVPERIRAWDFRDE
jgi:PPOX class probable F420-dependent enzyme